MDIFRKQQILASKRNADVWQRFVCLSEKFDKTKTQNFWFFHCKTSRYSVTYSLFFSSLEFGKDPPLLVHLTIPLKGYISKRSKSEISFSILPQFRRVLINFLLSGSGCSIHIWRPYDANIDLFIDVFFTSVLVMHPPVVSSPCGERWWQVVVLERCKSSSQHQWRCWKYNSRMQVVLHGRTSMLLLAIHMVYTHCAALARLGPSCLSAYSFRF